MPKRALVWPVLACILFLALAIVIIPLPGIQYDEALFTGPLYRDAAPSLSIGTRQHYVQVMLNSYLGDLKGLLYRPILHRIRPSVWSLRLPVVFLTAGAIVLTWFYTRRVAGWNAAAIAALLLAADPSFLLTATLDWGPVAFQHFLLMAGLVSLLRWLDRGSDTWLALAFFLWGLGFWDKALFIWPLSGLAVAALCIYPRRTLARIKLRPALAAGGALFAGSLPFIIYNAEHRGATAGQNSHFSLGESKIKVDVLRKTLDGYIMFEMLTPPAPAIAPYVPDSAWGRGCVWLAKTSGNHARTHFVWALALAALVAVFAANRQERRQMIFLLVAMSVAFLQMLIATGAGAAAHHEILLWPFPVVFFAIPFGALASARLRLWRYAAVVVVAAVSMQQLLTINRYVASFLTEGFPATWSDAIFGLSSVLRTQTAHRMEAVDWGIANALLLLSRGQVNPGERTTCLAESRSAARPDCGFPALMADPSTLFIRHTSGNEAFAGNNQHLERIAAANGYGWVIDRQINDSRGRPVFQILHFERRL